MPFLLSDSFGVEVFSGSRVSADFDSETISTGFSGDEGDVSLEGLVFFTAF